MAGNTGLAVSPFDVSRMETICRARILLLADWIERLVHRRDPDFSWDFDDRDAA
jgi:DNA-binding GntR family transcriptional regulator